MRKRELHLPRRARRRFFFGLAARRSCRPKLTGARAAADTVTSAQGSTAKCLGWLVLKERRIVNGRLRHPLWPYNSRCTCSRGRSRRVTREPREREANRLFLCILGFYNRNGFLYLISYTCRWASCIHSLHKNIASVNAWKHCAKIIWTCNWQ